MPALGVEETELQRPERFNVAIAIEDGERVAVFQNARAMIRETRSRAHVIFIVNGENVADSVW
jgi:hypothetical protein